MDGRRGRFEGWPIVGWSALVLLSMTAILLAAYGTEEAGVRVLIRATRSLISPGTERMIIDFGKAGWIEKARQQPDRVQQVIEKARTDGIVPTFEAVRSKLDSVTGSAPVPAQCQPPWLLPSQAATT